MFGLIGHLTSLEHAQSVAKELGYPEYADQGLDFWCSAPPQIVDTITVTSITGQKIEGRYVESCFLPEMLATRRIKAATRKVLNAMAHAQKHGINITALGGFSQLFSRTSTCSKIGKSAILNSNLTVSLLVTLTRLIFFAAKWSKRRNNWELNFQRRQLLSVVLQVILGVRFADGLMRGQMLQNCC
jgi:predicted amino acid dehydrogenase